MPAAARDATRRPSRSPLYAEAFEAAGALDRLEGFASHFGADFYGLPRNGDKVTLAREPWTVPADYPFGDGSGRAAARRRDGVLARGSATALTRPRGERNLAAAVLSYASEASQTVAARATGGRKVRAPQSRMPGNARPQ